MVWKGRVPMVCSIKNNTDNIRRLRNRSPPWGPPANGNNSNSNPYAMIELVGCRKNGGYSVWVTSGFGAQTIRFTTIACDHFTAIGNRSMNV